MQALETAVDGCRELRLDLHPDRRGWFLKLFNQAAFDQWGIALDIEELFVTRSQRDVVRGLHFQAPPADIAKLVCCLDGRIVDAVVDLRVGSPSYLQHCLVELSAESANAVYVPEGCAHGFLVTCDEALVAYAQSGGHDPVLEGGVLWSSAGIDWPGDPHLAERVILSDRDAAFPELESFRSPFRAGGG